MIDNMNHPITEPNLKGYQHVEGLWLPFIWFSEQLCANFIMQYWFKGCLIYRFEQGYLLRFPYAISGYCEQFEGWPLIKFENKLCSMMLSDNEKKLIPHGDIILLMGNNITALDYLQAKKIDPATWINIDDYPLLKVDEWPVEVVELEYIDPTLDMKAMDTILGESLPKPSKALLKFVKENNQKKHNMQPNTPSHSSQKAAPSGGIPIFIIVLIFLLIGSIIRGFNKTNKVTAPSSANTHFLSSISLIGWALLIIILISVIAILRRKKTLQTIFHHIHRRFIKPVRKTQQEGLNNNEPPRKESKRQRWRDYLAKFAILSQLHHWIKFRQSKYLDSMMMMFESGNLDEALKYAIPINGSDQIGQQAFRAPKPRDKLSFSEKIYGEKNSIYIDHQIQQQLQQLYRRSFEKLDKENRIEEAAFVLIELLNNLTEGIDYLEKKKRLQQALDIAITKDADPNLIVRLCCLTEQWDKAIMIAKRYDAFANAIMLLEKHNPTLANKLRFVWAQTLAERAEWLAAIDTIWPLKNHRNLTKKWFDYAEKTEEFNANIIIKKLILQPESISQYQQEIEQLQTDPQRYAQRLAIAVAILAHKQDISKLRSLLSSLINVIMFDMAHHKTSLTRADLIELIELTQDRALKIDLPAQQLKVKTRQTLSESRTLQWETCSKIGHRAIHDAMPMRNGHYLLALGEAGIIIVNKMGQQLKHFMITAHHFVVSHNFNQILALAKKDERHYHIHKLDLATENVISLGYLQFDASLSHFDGLNWTILSHNHIQVINVEQTLKIVWQVDLAGYQVIQFVSTPTNEKWLLKNADDQYEIWDYSLPDHRLTSRDNTMLYLNNIILNRYANNIYFDYSSQQQTILFQRHHWGAHQPLPLTITEKQFTTLRYVAIKEFIVFIIHKEHPNGQLIHLYHIESNTIKMTIDWINNNTLSFSTYEHDAIFWDNLGRCGRLNTLKNEWTYFTI